jgi:hypothetical protein
MQMESPPRRTPDSPPDTTSARACVSDAERRIFFDAFQHHFSFPEEPSKLNETYETVAKQLAPLNAIWTPREVRRMFNEFRSHFDRVAGRAEPGGTLADPSRSLSPRAAPSSLCDHRDPSPGVGLAFGPSTVPRDPEPEREVEPEAEVEIGVKPSYASAITATSFTTLMSDASAALSLINGVLAETGFGFWNLAGVEVFDGEVLNRGGRNGRVDFRGQTSDGRELIVETEVLWQFSFDDAPLSSAAAPFASCDFSVREAGETTQAEWIGRVDDIFVLHFVHYDLWEGRPESGGSLRIRHSLSDDGFVRIHLIEIALPRITVGFPVAAEVGLGWRIADWWYYLLKFAEMFTAEEIRRCRGLGMSPEIISGLRLLDLNLWGFEKRCDYWSEIEKMALERKMFESRRLIGEAIGRLEGEVEGREEGLSEGRVRGERIGRLQALIAQFVDTGSLSRLLVKKVREGFYEIFVRAIWDDTIGGAEVARSFEDFLGALADNGLLIE